MASERVTLSISCTRMFQLAVADVMLQVAPDYNNEQTRCESFSESPNEWWSSLSRWYGNLRTTPTSLDARARSINL